MVCPKTKKAREEEAQVKRYPMQNLNPFKQEAPYGTRQMHKGREYIYIPDPWTFPEGYGNAWCSVEMLRKDGFKV